MVRYFWCSLAALALLGCLVSDSFADPPHGRFSRTRNRNFSIQRNFDVGYGFQQQQFAVPMYAPAFAAPACGVQTYQQQQQFAPAYGVPLQAPMFAPAYGVNRSLNLNFGIGRRGFGIGRGFGF